VKRIFVLSSRSLFSQGLEILLRQDKGVELVGEETDVDRAIEGIRELSPDVVLLEQDSDGDPGPVVMRVLRETPSTKVVGLNLADNTIRVYRGEQRIPREIGDLLQVIKNDPCREESAGR
jgi:DNA-binding NarL/FixJ family response regulator